MTNNNFNIAEQTLLAPTGLSNSDLDRFMHALCDVSGSDFADLYFQYSKHESWSLDEGKVKTGSFNIDQGVGLRSVCGEKTAFAYSEDLRSESILAATEVVKAIGRQGQNVTTPVWRQSETSSLYNHGDPISGMSDPEKIAILELADRAARGHDDRVKEVMASLSAVYEVVLIVTSDGRQIPDVRPLIRLNVSVIVEQDGKRERGNMGGGGRLGLD